MAAVAEAARGKGYAMEEEKGGMMDGDVDRLTVDETEQYDRQIRLWGLDAQKRLRASRVLIVGVRGLGAEVSKNIVLAGVREVTLLDHTSLGSGDSAERFLMQCEGVNRAEQAVERLQRLNPNVLISADTTPLSEKNDDFFTRYDVVIATCCTTEELIRMNEVCRANGIKFFCGDIWGYYGYFFTDLGEHEYLTEVEKKEEAEEVMSLDGPRKKPKLEPEMITVKQTCSFCSLSHALSTDWSKKPPKYFRRIPPTFFVIQSLQLFFNKEGRRPSDSAGDWETLDQLKLKVASKCNISPDLIPPGFSQWCVSELSPVCAVVGGVLGQEVIKAISAKDHPYNNSFLYDGRQNTGIVELLRP